jgi:hypothetical protein
MLKPGRARNAESGLSLHKSPLILPFSPRGEGTVLRGTASKFECGACNSASLSQPYPLADMATFDGELAKASLRGEGWGEGVFSRN